MKRVVVTGLGIVSSIGVDAKEVTVNGRTYTAWNVSKVTDMQAMFCEASAFNHPLEQWNVSNVTSMKGMFCNAPVFNQYIGKWHIKSDCDIGRMFALSSVSKQTFEGKLYGNKIAEYFKLDNPDEDKVWKSPTRWERRKDAVMFFSSISKMNIDEESIESKNLNLIRKIDYDVYKEIVLFI